MRIFILLCKWLQFVVRRTQLRRDYLVKRPIMLPLFSYSISLYDNRIKKSYFSALHFQLFSREDDAEIVGNQFSSYSLSPSL